MGKEGKGKVGPRGNKLTRGIGINDADYPVFLRLGDGKVWHCPIYRHWSNMLTRCTSVDGKYSYDYQSNHNGTYVGVTVCDEWLSFMKFREWAIDKNYLGNQLDKDIIGDGTHYSPETCEFVPHVINTSIQGRYINKPEDTLLGVSYNKQNNKFRSTVRSDKEVVAKIKEFETGIDAHRYYQKNKAIALHQLAEKYLWLGEISLRVYERLKEKALLLENDLLEGRVTKTLRF
jgi:hypothetical protein